MGCQNRDTCCTLTYSPLKRDGGWSRTRLPTSSRGKGRGSCEAVVFLPLRRARGDGASQLGLAANRALSPAGQRLEGSGRLPDSWPPGALHSPRSARSRLRRPSGCHGNGPGLGGRAQLTSFMTRFGGAPHPPANDHPEGVPWVDVL